MENAEKVAKLKVFPTTKESENCPPFMHPGITANQIFYTNPNPNKEIPTCCRDAHHFYQRSCSGGQENQEFWRQRAHVAQHELMQGREPEFRGATSARMNLYHQPLDRCFPDPPETMQRGTRGECCCWNCRPEQCGTTQPANRGSGRGEEEDNFQLESDAEEELEPPLPLKDNEEWQHDSPLPHHYVHIYGGGQCNLDPVSRHPPQSSHQHRRPWTDPQNWVQCHDGPMCDCTAPGRVSVNVPQFSVPPVEGCSQVSVLNLRSAGVQESVSHPQERRRTVSLLDECRNVFITYSSDVSSEMVPFADFLTKQGFRPATDLFDSPIRRMDVNKWKDSYLKDPSTLIIIAISPKYKADIEGSVLDSHSLHTKYIHSMMQNEFIQQGSLNFRFIPVLFLSASQKHVPSWLQNTRVYRWPQDTQDLLLRLLREEKYIPPPVPVELTLVIRPVTTSAAATL